MAISSGCLSRFIVKDNGVGMVLVTMEKHAILALEIVVPVNAPLFRQAAQLVPTMDIQRAANVPMVGIIP